MTLAHGEGGGQGQRRSLSIGLRAALAAGLLAIGGILPGPTVAGDIVPSGRLDLDYAWPRADVEPLDDNFMLSSAQFSIEGDFARDWSFEVEYDFADGGEFDDLWLGYGGWKDTDIQVGQLKVPFGLEEATSSRNIMLIERALPIDAFGFSRRLGTSYRREGARYTLTVMGFTRPIDEDDSNGVAARYTFAPIDSDGKLLHFGVAAAIENPLDDEARFRARPEADAVDARFINTGKLRDARRVNRLGLETAWQSGPFTAQAEWMRAAVDRRDHPDASFDGWYVAGSWMLNGGQRRYKDGKFKSPSIADRFGTWELSARLSRVNLDDGAVQGGHERNLSLGLAWYLGKHGRIMFNYIQVDSTRRGTADNPDILLLRTQLFF